MALSRPLTQIPESLANHVCIILAGSHQSEAAAAQQLRRQRPEARAASGAARGAAAGVRSKRRLLAAATQVHVHVASAEHSVHSTAGLGR